MMNKIPRDGHLVIPISDPSSWEWRNLDWRKTCWDNRGEGISFSGRRMAQSQLNDRTLEVGLGGGCGGDGLGGRGRRGRKPKIIILGGSAEGGRDTERRSGPYFKPANVPLSVSISASAKFIPSVLLPFSLRPSSVLSRRHHTHTPSESADRDWGHPWGRIFSTLHAALN